MPAVDHERVLVKVKAAIAAKPSHGRDQLLSRIAQIEVACEVPEAQEGFDGVPVRRQHPVEQIDDDVVPSSNVRPAHEIERAARVASNAA